MAFRQFTTFVFAATMGLAGFLLFQVQPVMAKYILPWFGGSAATWIVCMLFFQVALLVGYAYAYAVTRPFPVTTQAKAQIALLLLVLLLLPITPADASKPPDAENPVGRILFLLAVNVGAPYVVLATTSPLLQRWLARIAEDVNVSRLFAVSNFGSFLGLLSYPFVFERFISSVEQTRWWSWAFVGYAVLFSVCALMTIRRAKGGAEEPMAAAAERAGGAEALFAWVFYPALGSVLLLATTNQITEWSAVIPFLWIAPLSAYLLTFVIAFGHQNLYHRALYSISFLVLATLTFFLARPQSSGGLVLQIGLQCATLFAGCMICHAETVKRQPEARRLPSFYLAIAVGGAIGGIVVALLAPLVFSDYWEHPLTIVAIGAVAFWLNLRTEPRRAPGWARPAVHAASGLFAVGLGFMLYGEAERAGNIVERARNFYGVVKIVKADADEPEKAYLAMEQAGIEQGSQFLAPERRLVPTCAYGAQSGIGRALAYHRKRREGAGGLRIGIIGLGAGMIAAYGRPGDYIRYYELNPAVADLANRRFTFLKETKAQVDVLLGDGRILLERESQGGQSQHFDILAIDAFRGASPPMHLLTQEAFEVYLRHLEPDGILAINSEFDVFEVAPLHRGLAARVGLSVNWFETPEDDNCEDPASWALYTRDQSLWAVPAIRRGISAWPDGATTQLVWTDSRSNLMSILNW